MYRCEKAVESQAALATASAKAPYKSNATISNEALRFNETEHTRAAADGLRQTRGRVIKAIVH